MLLDTPHSVTGMHKNFERWYLRLVLYGAKMDAGNHTSARGKRENKKPVDAINGGGDKMRASLALGV